MAGPAARGAATRSLAAKLDHLFAVVRPPGGEREYTGKEVVAAVNAAGTDLSASHLSELRRGVKTNPTVRVLEGLAAFFGVRTAYLLDDPQAVEEVEAELELRRAMADARVRELALRVADLAPHERAAMYRVLAEIVREHDAGPTT
jgi:transcriptional regulator with XRE-family HTH domain